MDFRITGFSTPFVGLSWEYSDSVQYIKSMKQLLPKRIEPNETIKVFISSKCCDKGRYDAVRAKLKRAIEDTGLAKVYLFEDSGASIFTAGEHYSLALQESDVCIFLIDNADDVPQGVKKEIDIAQKFGVKSLFYFCDEKTTEKTATEQSLMGVNFAKSVTVHSFDELAEDGAVDLINDIISVFQRFCRGLLIPIESGSGKINKTKIAGNENLSIPIVPGSVLEDIDKCKDYISKISTNCPLVHYPGEKEKSSAIDDWGALFLSVLFEGKSIKCFNAEMFLNELKKLQDEKYNSLVRIRWQAIQMYFLGDVENCIKYLEAALKEAKDNQHPKWIIKDILIDIRNLQVKIDTIKHTSTVSKSSAQKELDESNEKIYYPMLDRFSELFYEKLVENLYKKKIQSPYTVTFGNAFKPYGELLVSSYIVSLYNGSLTHLLLLYKKTRDFTFFLSSVYDDWFLKKDLLKYAIFYEKEKEIREIADSFPDILNNIDANDAASIMAFCNNHCIEYERLGSQLLAFGTVGYFLNEKDFAVYKELLINIIKAWIKNDNAIISIGWRIFACLKGVFLRLPQNELAEICGLLIERKYRHFYRDLFGLIANCIRLQKMDEDVAKRFVSRVVSIFEDEEGFNIIKQAPHFLGALRKQSQTLTEELDSKVAQFLPEYYGSAYTLDSTTSFNRDFPSLIKYYLQTVKEDNIRQGEGGHYVWHAIREIEIIRRMILEKDYLCDDLLVDSILATLSNTLLQSKQELDVKLDAINLMTCIINKYPDSVERNKQVLMQIIDRQEDIKVPETDPFSSNVDVVALKIGLQLLSIALKVDTFQNMLELMSLIQDDKATTHKVTDSIIKYLEVSDTVVFPPRIEIIVLQNVLQWLRSGYLDIRWNATRILLTMLRNPENRVLVNHQLITLIDSDCYYIKNLIMRQLNQVEGITEASRNYIISKCENDSNYVVRMVCKEEKGKLNTSHRPTVL